MPRFLQSLTLCSGLLLISVEPQAAGSRWAYCTAEQASGITTQPLPLAVTKADRASATLELDADNITRQAGGRLRLTGQATARRADQQLRADTLEYDPAQGVLKASGDVDFREPGFNVQGNRLSMSLKRDQLHLQGAHYQLFSAHAHGRADSLTLQGQQTVDLQSVSYTTCRATRPDWELRAKRIHLDREKGVAKVRHVQLRFMDVPVFYSPYLSFPLDTRRKSGFLAPGIGNSNTSGLELAIPYYWNIAPQRDLTLTPHYYQKRGLRLDTEYRYLGVRQSGTFNLEYMPRDDITGEARGALAIKQQARLGRNWYWRTDLNHISDLNYFNDFATSLRISSRTYLQRLAELDYAGDWLQLTARAQAFQNIDRHLAKTDRPYRRLPQIVMRGELPWRPAGIRLSLNSEWVRFQSDDLTNQGTRLDLWPRISLPWRKPGYYIEPSFSLRHTRYRLNTAEAGINKQAERSLSIFSLDSGLIFERKLSWAGQTLHQTLEPRVYYLRVPYRNQQDLPVFDTGQRDFNFDELFRENRFSGADRMNSANQLSLAITSRWLSELGREKLRASFGQTLSFDKRRVTLPGSVSGTEPGSTLVAELSARPVRTLNLRTTLQWDEKREQTRLGTFQLHYQPGKERILNLAYRQRQGMLKQTDLSLLWPLTFLGQGGRHWHIIGRWSYSLRDRRSLETLAGVAYDNCCWSLRVFTRRYVTDGSSNRNSNRLSTYLQFELKGLAGLGRSVGNQLERGILGYSQDRL